MPNESEGGKPAGDSQNDPLLSNIVPPQQGVPRNQNAATVNNDFATAETQRELHWLEKLNFGGQFCLVIVGIVAACIYGRQLNTMNSQLTQMSKQSSEIEKQTDLMKDETIGTKGALLQFDPHLNVLSSLKGDSPVFVNQIRAVTGRVTAQRIAVELSVQRVALPSKKPIGSPIRCDLHMPQMASNGIDLGMSGEAKVCELPGFNQRDGDDVMFMRQTVTISGSMEYNNGFGQIIHENICKTFLGYRYKGEEKVPNGTINLISGGDESFHDCSDFDRVLHRAILLKNKYQENYVPSHP